MTFGYHRVGIFAALVNAVSLVIIALLVGWEAFAHIRHPEAANAALMIGVASAAIVVNLAIALRLRRGVKDDINVRSAYLHVVGDAATAVSVAIAGAVIARPHTPPG